MPSKKLERLADNLERIANNPDAFIQAVIERHLDDFEDAQREQMQLGLNAEGKPIGYLRSTVYAREKKAKGGRAPFGIVDLKDTGKFQKGVHATQKNRAVFMDSTDSKTQELKEKYNRNGSIFGFTISTKLKLKERLLPTARFQILRDVRP